MGLEDVFGFGFSDLVDQEAGAIKPENAQAQAYIAWSTVHGLASVLVDGHMRYPDDVEAPARLATTVLLEGMKA
jgi:hypothetical protein